MFAHDLSEAFDPIDQGPSARFLTAALGEIRLATLADLAELSQVRFGPVLDSVAFVVVCLDGIAVFGPLQREDVLVRKRDQSSRRRNLDGVDLIPLEMILIVSRRAEGDDLPVFQVIWTSFLRTGSV